MNLSDWNMAMSSSVTVMPMAWGSSRGEGGGEDDAPDISGSYMDDSVRESDDMAGMRGPPTPPNRASCGCGKKSTPGSVATMRLFLPAVGRGGGMANGLPPCRSSGRPM